MGKSGQAGGPPSPSSLHPPSQLGAPAIAPPIAHPTEKRNSRAGAMPEGLSLPALAARFSGSACARLLISVRALLPSSPAQPPSAARSAPASASARARVTAAGTSCLGHRGRCAAVMRWGTRTPPRRMRCVRRRRCEAGAQCCWRHPTTAALRHFRARQLSADRRAPRLFPADRRRAAEPQPVRLAAAAALGLAGRQPRAPRHRCVRERAPLAAAPAFLISGSSPTLCATPTPAAGYGIARVPAATGHHALEVACWRPEGSLLQELSAFFLGALPQLTDTSVLIDSSRRQQLSTVTTGSVMVRHAAADASASSVVEAVLASADALHTWHQPGAHPAPSTCAG